LYALFLYLNDAIALIKMQTTAYCPLQTLKVILMHYYRTD